MSIEQPPSVEQWKITAGDAVISSWKPEQPDPWRLFKRLNGSSATSTFASFPRRACCAPSRVATVEETSAGPACARDSYILGYVLCVSECIFLLATWCNKKNCAICLQAVRFVSLKDQEATVPTRK
ncbi:hypothetical protein K0M31_010344 [Melipona bicolor]|uniref:Uncharacterized protein n=1 Tax=Melipona bicolor TaxID=60889 RepID=A0AA40FMC1_9HYME|nr:hypothetical protein K0M31_010344 [Melipona bicolor]